MLHIYNRIYEAHPDKCINKLILTVFKIARRRMANIVHAGLVVVEARLDEVLKITSDNFPMANYLPRHSNFMIKDGTGASENIGDVKGTVRFISCSSVHLIVMHMEAATCVRPAQTRYYRSPNADHQKPTIEVVRKERLFMNFGITDESTSSLDRIQLDIQDLRNPWVLRLPYPSRTNN
ncbi:predicted protein [Sclerotinia sclerotiorum 1980 UF-70]|uniref:Uncharacterized protein n=1 Tax=Sclerotinia sclerotiorum (strain ATCC 18683 / 1980 / Ss-1) TaxID=665079 RepID=A7F1G9_SCLS1|nr:predicted protein [Sclerotinia sclerotiorum 1980 UF-70]EDN95561.1 predicted protein [Sclerotinia sclerotiorum 1980 UF-70]